MSVLFAGCVAAIAAFHQLPPRALLAIQATEGGRVGMVVRNTNGSEDLGVMQINTLWIVPLVRATRQSPDRVRQLLIQDGCFNIAAAGAILRLYREKARGDLMTAIGYYHSHTPARHTAYRQRVLASAYRLFGSNSGPQNIGPAMVARAQPPP